ncbi:hypothetical protein JQ556_35115 [Bradyrhizobium ottawaense]|nr:hypothetical protein [Bradyrhizobium ottawaense]
MFNDFERAVSLMDRAQELDPNLAMAFDLSGQIAMLVAFLRVLDVSGLRRAKEPADPARSLIASPLFQTHRYPAYCSRNFGANLWAAELQDHAIGISQLDAPAPAATAPPAPIAL